MPRKKGWWDDASSRFEIIEKAELERLQALDRKAQPNQNTGPPPAAGMSLGWALVTIVILNLVFFNILIRVAT